MNLVNNVTRDEYDLIYGDPEVERAKQLAYLAKNGKLSEKEKVAVMNKYPDYFTKNDTKGTNLSPNTKDIGFKSRFYAKNFGGNYKDKVAGLQKDNPDLDFSKDVDENILYRAKGSSDRYKRLDPEGFDLQDITDVAVDVAGGGIDVLAGAAGAAAGLIDSGGTMSVPQAAAMYGLSSAGVEALRNAIGSYVGYNKLENMPGDVALAGALGGIAAPAGALGGKAIRGLAKATNAGNILEGLSKYLYKGTTGSLDRIAEMAGKEKGAVTKIAQKYGLTGNEEKMGKGLLSLKNNLYKKLEGTVDDVAKQIEANPELYSKSKINLRDIDDKIIKELKTVYNNTDDTALQKTITKEINSLRRSLIVSPYTRKEVEAKVAEEAKLISKGLRKVDESNVVLKNLLDEGKTPKDVAKIIADRTEEELGGRFVTASEKKAFTPEEIAQKVERGLAGEVSVPEAFKLKTNMSYSDKLAKNGTSPKVIQTTANLRKKLLKDAFEENLETANPYAYNAYRELNDDFGTLASVNQEAKALWKKEGNKMSAWDERMLALSPKAAGFKKLIDLASAPSVTTGTASFLHDAGNAAKKIKPLNALSNVLEPLANKIPSVYSKGVAKRGLMEVPKKRVNKSLQLPLYNRILQGIRRD